MSEDGIYDEHQADPNMGEMPYAADTDKPPTPPEDSSYVTLARQAWDQGNKSACIDFLLELFRGCGKNGATDRLVVDRLMFHKNRVETGEVSS